MNETPITSTKKDSWLTASASFIKTNRVYITLALFALVLLGWCMPLLTSNPLTITSTFDAAEEEFVFTVTNVLEPSGVWIGSLTANGVNYLSILLFIVLPLLPLVLSIWGIWKKEALVASAMLGLVFSVLVFVSPEIFDVGQSLAQLGIESGGLGCYDFSAYAETELNAGAIFMTVLSFFASCMALASASEKETISARNLAEIALLSALAIGLQFIRVPIGATGGSINLGLVPLAFLALRHGPAKGFIAGAFIFGLVTCLTDGYGFYTYPFDYLIGFGSIAVFGFFSRLIFTNNEQGWTAWGFLWLFVAAVGASLVRFIGSTVSSMVIYGYDFYGACTYNVVYIFVTGAVTYAVLALLYIPFASIQKNFPPQTNKKEEIAEAK